MRVYFAGPLFNEAEKRFNLSLAAVLEEAGYSVFLPQRDGLEAAKLTAMTAEQKTASIFHKDIGEIDNADVLFMVLDGRVPDEGACVELGYAYAKGKRCYALTTDQRAIELDLRINPMLAGCFLAVLDCPSGDAVNELRAHLATHTL